MLNTVVLSEFLITLPHFLFCVSVSAFPVPPTQSASVHAVSLLHSPVALCIYGLPRSLGINPVHLKIQVFTFTMHFISHLGKLVLRIDERGTLIRNW